MKKLDIIFRLTVIVLLVFLISMSSHPEIVLRSKCVGLESGTNLSRYVVIVFGLLFVLCFIIKSFIRSPFIRTSLLMLFLILFTYLFTFSFFSSNIMWGDFRAIGICIISIIIGWQICLNRKYFFCCSIVFCFNHVCRINAN